MPVSGSTYLCGCALYAAPIKYDCVTRLKCSGFLKLAMVVLVKRRNEKMAADSKFEERDCANGCYVVDNLMEQILEFHSDMTA